MARRKSYTLAAKLKAISLSKRPYDSLKDCEKAFLDNIPRTNVGRWVEQEEMLNEHGKKKIKKTLHRGRKPTITPDVEKEVPIVICWRLIKRS
jgi:hypothetical protein